MIYIAVRILTTLCARRELQSSDRLILHAKDALYEVVPIAVGAPNWPVTCCAAEVWSSRLDAGACVRDKALDMYVPWALTCHMHAYNRTGLERHPCRAVNKQVLRGAHVHLI